MKYRFFAVPALDPEVAASELNGFLGSVRVANLEKNLIADGQRSFWAVCVAYWEGGAPAAGRGARIDYREVFDEKDFALFARLREAILDETAPAGRFRQFVIADPKTRIIHAACFQDRVLHHALMHLAGPVLERTMVPTTYACRPGKGPLAGVHRVQRNVRRFPWLVKIDIAKYFASVDHKILLDLLDRRFKGRQGLALMARILGSYETDPGKGLPIGSLTSQHFANFYLDGLDRFLLEDLGVAGHVRYMDDVIWWCASRGEAKASLQEATEWLVAKRRLALHRNSQVNRSAAGVTFCGFRVKPGALLLSRRRRRRYSEQRTSLEQAFVHGRIGALELQARFASVLAITAHGDSLSWRRQELRRRPCPIEG
ncbi:MAG: reverse transcriptase/maturase family protein [Thermodesulfobacteriota bacterium]